jgi:hypothetical protein
MVQVGVTESLKDDMPGEQGSTEPFVLRYVCVPKFTYCGLSHVSCLNVTQ